MNASTLIGHESSVSLREALDKAKNRLRFFDCLIYRIWLQQPEAVQSAIAATIDEIGIPDFRSKKFMGRFVACVLFGNGRDFREDWKINSSKYGKILSERMPQ